MCYQDLISWQKPLPHSPPTSFNKSEERGRYDRSMASMTILNAFADFGSLVNSQALIHTLVSTQLAVPAIKSFDSRSISISITLLADRFANCNCNEQQ